MKRNISKNPDRACIKCGEVGNNIEYKQKGNLEIRWKPICAKCYGSNAKELTFDVCNHCGESKQNNYRRKCQECESKYHFNRTRPILGDDLVLVKRWVEKQMAQKYWIDMMGLNELIEMWSKINIHEYSGSHLSTGNQLYGMWKTLWKFYDEQLKFVPDELLKEMECNRSNLELVDMKKKINEYMNVDMKVFQSVMNQIEEFEIGGKIYNFKTEFNLCTSGNKAACVRCRKLIQKLRKDLVGLKIITTKMTKSEF